MRNIDFSKYDAMTIYRMINCKSYCKTLTEDQWLDLFFEYMDHTELGHYPNLDLFYESIKYFLR